MRTAVSDVSEIPVYLPGGVELSVSPTWLYEYFRLQILGANSYNVPKFERAVAGVAKARAQGDLDAARCDELDRLVARKRREMAADGGNEQ